MVVVIFLMWGKITESVFKNKLTLVLRLYSEKTIY